MIILGIDPGTLVTGWGVIETNDGMVRMLGCGTVKNKPRLSMPLRLRAIYDGLTDVIETHRPDECAIETAFYGKNAQSALKIGHARGVSILAAVLREVPTAEYSPREVKKAVTGNGGSSKQKVQFMVKHVLRLRSTPKELDATDAVAVALCHLQASQGKGLRRRSHGSSWKEFLEAHPEKVLNVR